MAFSIKTNHDMLQLVCCLFSLICLPGRTQLLEPATIFYACSFGSELLRRNAHLSWMNNAGPPTRHSGLLPHVPKDPFVRNTVRFFFSPALIIHSYCSSLVLLTQKQKHYWALWFKFLTNYYLQENEKENLPTFCMYCMNSPIVRLHQLLFWPPYITSQDNSQLKHYVGTHHVNEWDSFKKNCSSETLPLAEHNGIKSSVTRDNDGIKDLPEGGCRVEMSSLEKECGKDC